MLTIFYCMFKPHKWSLGKQNFFKKQILMTSNFLLVLYLNTEAFLTTFYYVFPLWELQDMIS